MKKALVLLLTVFFLMAGFAFAEDDDNNSPLSVSGQLDFSIGDTLGIGVDAPTFNWTRSATATLGISGMDDRVQAEIGVNLLAPVSVDTQLEGLTPDGELIQVGYFEDEPIFFQGYYGFQEQSRIIAFWNANVETEIVDDSGELIWDDEVSDIADIVEAALDGFADREDDDTFTMYTIVAADPDEGQVSAADVDATFGMTAVADLQTQVVDALNKIIDAGSDELDSMLDVDAVGVVTVVDSSWDTLSELDATDEALARQAITLSRSYRAAIGVDTEDIAVSSTVTQDFITSATLRFVGVANVLDIDLFFGGQRASAGPINVDGAGHSATAVPAYSGVGLSITEGLFEGLDFGINYYIDDNGVQTAVDDDPLTWLDESEPEVLPRHALSTNVGISTELNGIQLGSGLEYAIYDITGDDSGMGLAVTPSVAAFDATLDQTFALGLGNLAGVMYSQTDLGYSLTDFGVSVGGSFYYVQNSDDYVVGYSAVPRSVLAKVRNDGGMAAAANLGLDLGVFVPVAVNVDGGVTLGLADNDLAWNAGLSVAPIDAVTLGFTASADEVLGSTFDWEARVDYDYSEIADIYATISSDYDFVRGDNFTSYAIGTSVSF